jgi:hypothetical protein
MRLKAPYSSTVGQVGSISKPLINVPSNVPLVIQ